MCPSYTLAEFPWFLVPPCSGAVLYYLLCEMLLSNAHVPPSLPTTPFQIFLIVRDGEKWLQNSSCPSMVLEGSAPFFSSALSILCFVNLPFSQWVHDLMCSFYPFSLVHLMATLSGHIIVCWLRGIQAPPGCLQVDAEAKTS